MIKEGSKSYERRLLAPRIERRYDNGQLTATERWTAILGTYVVLYIPVGRLALADFAQPTYAGQMGPG
ncbi:hypothetical protein GWE18_24970 [Bradyrhizobium sp. CSA112]|uniref:hypothetical protein n=1 Tax=Bradyrhizobium sp. CSA112 TaxID=2699170 RepID=UPI0023B10CB8|nr:hypothetical protein [Bradyrhizobium sp. CSA112]MDE5456020.1 hypothetical protein [Bradyrhizobium sp. CSA112]